MSISSKSVVLVACHVGQAKALIPIARLLVQRGCRVIMLLDANEKAAELYEDGELDFPTDCVVCVDAMRDLPLNITNAIRDAHRVLVTLSPVEAVSSLENRVYSHCANSLSIPIWGYSEVVCGHRAPAWKGLLSGFDQLFAAKKTKDLEQMDNIVDVGMDIPIIDRVRALETKTMLGIPEKRQFIWYCGGPYPRSAEILRMFVGCCGALQELANAPVDIVFSRHSRDDTAVTFYQETVSISKKRGVRMVENSADHLRGTSAQRDEIIPYSQLFEACSEGGVIVTGHGTDGLKAPYVGIPSILCVGDDLNPHIKKEKGCQVLPLPEYCPIQVTSHDRLMPALLYCFRQRDAYQEMCRQHYPVQEKTPAEIIVEVMLQ